MARRNRNSQPFWRITPNGTSDPGALYRHGVECLNKRDGRGMLASGWALCQVGALHENQAGDFLTDGYRIWRESPGFDRNEAAAFLTDLFDALRSLTPPPVPSDISSASPEQVVPASVYHGTRCWAGNELLEATPDSSVRQRYEPLVFEAVTEAPKELVPNRSVDFALGYAGANGMDEPWAAAPSGSRDRERGGSTGATSSGPEEPTASSNGSAAPPRSRPRPNAGGRPAPESAQRQRPSSNGQDARPADPATVTSPAQRREQPQPANAGPPAAPAPERQRPRPRPTTGQAAGAAAAAASTGAAEQNSWPAPHQGDQQSQPNGQQNSWPAPQQGDQQSQPNGQQLHEESHEESHEEEVPAPLRQLRERLAGWLSERYRDVQSETNGWITVPDIGPTVLQVETGALSAGHLKVEIFAPLVVDVPVTEELLRYAALQGTRFHLGAVTLDADDDVTPGAPDARGLLQFSHTLLADGLSHDAFLASVYLIAETVAEQSPELQRRFGGVLVADLAS